MESDPSRTNTQITVRAYWSPLLTTLLFSLVVGYHWWAIASAYDMALAFSYLVLWWLAACMLYWARWRRYVPSLCHRVKLVDCRVTPSAQRASGYTLSYLNQVQHVTERPVAGHQFYVFKRKPMYW